MQLNNDSIQLESREEIEKLLDLVKEWKKDHPQDAKQSQANSLQDMLEALYICW